MICDDRMLARKVVNSCAIDIVEDVVSCDADEIGGWGSTAATSPRLLSHSSGL